ncbi:MAG: response regulator transcription factor [Chloroflexota bacterium]|nr:response regulator transcription factor [Chloroflexota bacterium]
MPKLRGSRSVIRERPYKHNGQRTAKMKRFLLVEDHALFREGLALLLEWRTGLGSVQAGSLAEAERILTDTKDKPACAIVDLDLPDGDGIELLEQLRGLPILALTTGRNLERRARALEVGADEVLSTAESAERIADVVGRLLDG